MQNPTPYERPRTESWQPSLTYERAAVPRLSGLYRIALRPTGARYYFEVPLAQAWQIYRQAMSQGFGLARTARGPSMSAAPGKVEIQGVAHIRGEAD